MRRRFRRRCSSCSAADQPRGLPARYAKGGHRLNPLAILLGRRVLPQGQADHSSRIGCRGRGSDYAKSLTIPWQKPPFRKSRQLLLPRNTSRSEVRPERFERRARLVSAIARGRRWLDDVVSGRVTTVAELCAREKCSVRQVNMIISLAFLAPNLWRGRP